MLVGLLALWSYIWFVTSRVKIIILKHATCVECWWTLYFIFTTAVRVNIQDSLLARLSIITTLRHQAMIVIFTVPPSIGETERALTVNQNEVAELPCHSEGFPPPKISWIREGRSHLETRGKYEIRQSGSLVITGVQVIVISGFKVVSEICPSGWPGNYNTDDIKLIKHSNVIMLRVILEKC